ncbi:MAG: FAD-dependent oxidoreductase [Candidatus Omnitrophica bacterium]|nr:FAD-dependent oxidoreductase [Candidatus Omnitrophota bacterium]
MNPPIYDLIIIGAGPAGMTAAVYAARKKMNFILMSIDIGGQAAWSGDIENYTGYQFITGPELALKFQEHINAFGIEVLMPEVVKDIIKRQTLVIVKTEKLEYTAKSIIIATGKRPNQLNVPGEIEYKNKGLTYCATCDGPIFKGKDVAVIGGGNSGLDAVMQLNKICPKVYLITNDSKLTGDLIMIEKVRSFSNVEIIYNAAVSKVSGDVFVKTLSLKQSDKEIDLNVEGIFVEIGLIPNSECAAILAKNNKGEIIIDAHNQTNIEGIFAAGDVTDIPEKQIIIACGEGSKACLSSFHYLSTHNL